MATETTHTRENLPGKLAKEIQYQIQGLSRKDLSAYTYDHVKSSFKDAKTDLSVYDNDGTMVLRGRGFGDRTFFWTAALQDVRLAN
jgi:hypothetical protein